MIGIRDEYAPKFGRQTLTLWSGWCLSDYEGTAWELPNHDGFMVTLAYRGTVRIACESPRTEQNYERVDAAIAAGVGQTYIYTDEKESHEARVALYRKLVNR